MSCTELSCLWCFLHAARHRVQGCGIRKAVPPLFDRDLPDAPLGWRFDRFGPAAACGKPAHAVDGGLGAYQHLAYMLWVVVLAIALLRAQVEQLKNDLDGRSDSG
jgi:hypothetical protein